MLRRMLGGNYGRIKSTGSTAFSPARMARIREFILQYAHALQLQLSGSHIIVYMDESYVALIAKKIEEVTVVRDGQTIKFGQW